MEKNRIDKVKLCMVFVFLNMLFYGIFNVQHFAADTYMGEVYGWKFTADIYWSNGRWIMSFIAMLCEWFHISFALEKLISWVIAVLSLSVGEMVFYQILKRKVKSEQKSQVLMVIISFMTISNLFVLEYFIFTEYTGAICLGILFSILGVKNILLFLEQRKKIYYIVGIFFSVLGIMGHQGTFGIGVVLLIILTEDVFLNIRTFIEKSIVIGSAYIIPALTNVLQTKIAGSGRVTQKLDIVGALKTTANQTWELILNTANFMPRYVYLFFVLVSGIVLLFFLYRKKDIRVLLQSLYAGVIFLLAVCAPFLMTEIEYISVVPRTVYIMGAIVPVILLLIMVQIGISQKEIKMFVGFCVIFLSIQYFGVCKMETSHYAANAIDYYEVNCIKQKIWDYEGETGNTVKNIKIYSDESPVFNYYGLTSFGAINERVMSNTWASVPAFIRYSGIYVQAGSGDSEIYEKYFKGKNWWLLEDEQFVFIGDTLHLCLY